MYLKESNAWIIAGLFFFILGLAMVFVIIPAEIAEVKDVLVTPRFFPRIICTLMAILGADLAYLGYRKGQKAAKTGIEERKLGVSMTGAKYIVVTFGVLALYVVSFSFCPFIISTPILMFVLMWFYGQRSKVKLVGVAVLLPVLTYLAFTYLLQLRLP